MSQVTPREKRQGLLFLALVVGLLLASVGFMGYTLYRATSDPTFAIEPDYYQKALKWDATQAERSQSAALGWDAQVEISRDTGGKGATLVRLRGPDGAAVAGASVEGVCFPFVRSNDRRTIEFKEREPGVYVAEIAYPVSGRWEFRLSAVRGDSKFIAAKDLTVPGP